MRIINIPHFENIFIVQPLMPIEGLEYCRPEKVKLPPQLQVINYVILKSFFLSLQTAMVGKRTQFPFHWW